MTEEQKKLVEDNINFARHLAYKYVLKGTRQFEYDEIFSLFCYALCKASVGYDPKQGYKFTTYASKCMINEINMAFRLKITSREYFELGEVVFESEGGNELTFTDTIPNDYHLKYDELLDLMVLKEAIKELDERDLLILKLRFYNEDIQEDISRRMNISRTYVSRLENRLIKKLRILME